MTHDNIQLSARIWAIWRRKCLSSAHGVGLLLTAVIRCRIGPSQGLTGIITHYNETNYINVTSQTEPLNPGKKLEMQKFEAKLHVMQKLQRTVLSFCLWWLHSQLQRVKSSIKYITAFITVSHANMKCTVKHLSGLSKQ